MKLIRKIEENTITYYSNQTKILWFREEADEYTAYVYAGGELLSETTYEFQDEISAFISLGMDIIVDFENVSYLSFSYMQALLKIQISTEQSEKGSVKLINIPSQIYSELEKTGITELLWIE